MVEEIKKKKLPFPKEQKYSNEYLKENFWKCLYKNSSLSYQYWIILPNSLKPLNLNPVSFPKQKLVNIGQYMRMDSSPYLEVLVAYEHCKYEINPMDWLLKKLAIMGEYAINYEEIEGRSTGKYLDVLTYKKLQSGEDVISRFTTIKNYDSEKSGANYFLVKASCFEKDYEELAYTFLQIVHNWDLENKGKWQMAENLTPFRFDFIEEVNFFVPVSWNILIEDQDPNCIRFLFRHDETEKNIGVINAFFYSDINLIAQKVFEKSFNRLKDLKTDLDDLKRTIAKNPKILELYYSEGEVEYEEENFHANIMIYILKTTKAWYYFEAIGSHPNLENYNWEANKRCLELIVNSFNNSEFENISTNKTIISKEADYNKIYKGKKYTQEEWEKKEQELWEEYAFKNNIKTGNSDAKKKGGKFFLDEKESDS